MARPAVLRTATYPLPLAARSRRMQPPLESAIIARRPEGQHTSRSERREPTNKTRRFIKPRVRRRGQRGRPVIHVEQHGVETAWARSQRHGDVTGFDAHARIVQRVPRQHTERSAIPFDNGRHQLDEEQVRGCWQDIEGGAKREAHAEAADEHMRPRQGAGATTAQHGERLFRAVDTTRHQALTAGPDDVLGCVADQRQLGAIGRPRSSENRPRLHGRGITEGPNALFRRGRACGRARSHERWARVGWHRPRMLFGDMSRKPIGWNQLAAESAESLAGRETNLLHARSAWKTTILMSSARSASDVAMQGTHRTCRCLPYTDMTYTGITRQLAGLRQI